MLLLLLLPRQLQQICEADLVAAGPCDKGVQQQL
jgi:hypothetical protein